MSLLETRASVRFLNPRDKRKAACVRTAPECMILGVREGETPSAKPPVRIFLGTEPAQHRAERIFVWSIEQTRDPSRVYEIYLMKDLAGFDRRGWTTGFTNYRFAVPHLASGTGRAIFNDVDEAYFGDPAGLFDLDMEGHGYLATSDTETSVMLIDCERMVPIWTLEATQRELKKDLLARTLRIPGIRGDLPVEWTARDEEFVEGRSKLQHWTTLHTQPWRPVPGRFVYQPNPAGGSWFELERSADTAGYQVFSAARPSSLYASLMERLRAAPRTESPAPPGPRGVEQEGLGERVAMAGAKTILEYRLGQTDDAAGAPERHRGGAQQKVTRCDLALDSPPRRHAGRFDGVVCERVLEYLPDEDVPWVIDELFDRARTFVYAGVAHDSQTEVLSDATRLRSQPREPSWWNAHFEAASRRHPELHWTLALTGPSAAGRRIRRLRDGGRCLRGAPIVWVLTDERPQDTSQSLALAESLGWPCERKALRFNGLARLPHRLRGATRVGLDRGRSATLAPPWPDVVIAAGPRTASVARWIRKQSLGRTRLVQLGPEGGETAELFDAVVTPAHRHLWPHPRRIETVAPLTRRAPERPAPALQHGYRPFAAAAHPRVVLLLDAPNGRHHPKPETVRRMGAEVHALARASGGSAFAAVAAETDREIVAALTRGLRDARCVFRWSRGSTEDSIQAYLEMADAIVVSGHDESLLARAAACGKPAYIYPTAERKRLDLARWLREAVARRAQSRPSNARGTLRPQQGLEYLCARLIERGIVAPPLDLEEFQQKLCDLGIAARFGTALETGARPALREADEVARRVGPLLGYA